MLLFCYFCCVCFILKSPNRYFSSISCSQQLTVYLITGHYKTIFFTFVVFPESSTLFKASIMIIVRKPARVILSTISVRSRIRSRTFPSPDPTDFSCSPGPCWLPCVLCWNQSLSSSSRRFSIFRGTKKRIAVSGC